MALSLMLMMALSAWMSVSGTMPLDHSCSSSLHISIIVDVSDAIEDNERHHVSTALASLANEIAIYRPETLATVILNGATAQMAADTVPIEQLTEALFVQHIGGQLRLDAGFALLQQTRQWSAATQDLVIVLQNGVTSDFGVAVQVTTSLKQHHDTFIIGILTAAYNGAAVAQSYSIVSDPPLKNMLLTSNPHTLSGSILMNHVQSSFPCAVHSMPSSTATSSVAQTTVQLTVQTQTRLTSCSPGIDFCHQCDERGETCLQCRDRTYLLGSVCVEHCPVGYDEIGTGNFNRKCDPVPTTRAQNCNNGENHCVLCSSVSPSCIACGDFFFLHRGQCLAECPRGYLGNGVGAFSRWCELSAPFVAPAGFELQFEGATPTNADDARRYTTAFDPEAQLASVELDLATCAQICANLRDCLGFFSWIKEHNQEMWCSLLRDLGRTAGAMTSVNGYSIRKLHTTPETTKAYQTTLATVTTTSAADTITIASTTVSSATTPSPRCPYHNGHCMACDENNLRRCLHCQLPWLLTDSGDCVQFCPQGSALERATKGYRCKTSYRTDASPTTTTASSETACFILDEIAQPQCQCSAGCSMCTSRAHCQLCGHGKYLLDGVCVDICPLSRTPLRTQSQPFGRACTARVVPVTHPDLVSLCANGVDLAGARCTCGGKCAVCSLVGGQPYCSLCSDGAYLQNGGCVESCENGMVPLSAGLFHGTRFCFGIKQLVPPHGAVSRCLNGQRSALDEDHIVNVSSQNTQECSCGSDCSHCWLHKLDFFTPLHRTAALAA